MVLLIKLAGLYTYMVNVGGYIFKFSNIFSESSLLLLLVGTPN